MTVPAFIAGFTGVSGMMSANKSSKTANRMASSQLALAQEELDFAKEKYERWRSIYGPIEENLGEFMFKLTPEQFSAQGLESFQKQYQQEQQQLTEFFAVNDIGSGVQADLRTKSSNEAARTKAKIQQTAPFEVAQAQQNFIALGTGQGNNATSSRSAAANNLTSILGQQASIAADSASAGYEAANTGLTALADYYETTKTANTGNPHL